MKITDDKYYTPIPLANLCIDMVIETIGMENIKFVIEPSCGAGAFFHNPSLKINLGIDIKPELQPPEGSEIIEGDFLNLEMPYHKGTLIIGNPPWGDRCNLARQFFKKAIQIGDYVAFILPISQLRNNAYLYDFDLIYSEDLGYQVFSGHRLHCCFNIYQRPKNGINRKPHPSYEYVSIKRNGDLGYDEFDYDFRMCARGCVGKILNADEEYNLVFKIKVKDENHTEQVLQIIQDYDWDSIPTTSSKNISKSFINTLITNGMKKYYFVIIHKPGGKAGEYACWSIELYVGCSQGCYYCFNKRGRFSGVLGGSIPVLKKDLGNEAKALEVFKKELAVCKAEIIQDGGFFFSFLTDPCAPETITLIFMCIDYAISQGVPCKILTKRADWLDNPVVQNALSCKDMISVGFTLTGCDNVEPSASPNEQRIEAMKTLHNAGVSTWASIEPILDPGCSLDMIEKSMNYCDHYKIGILSGVKSYTPQEIRKFKNIVESLNLPSVYWKKSLLKYIDNGK